MSVYFYDKGVEVWKTNNNEIIKDPDLFGKLVGFAREASKGVFTSSRFEPVWFDDKYLKLTDACFSKAGLLVYSDGVPTPRRIVVSGIVTDGKDGVKEVMKKVEVVDKFPYKRNWG